MARVLLQDEFNDITQTLWQVTQQGNGSVIRRYSSLHLSLFPVEDDSGYHNAQISDYTPQERVFRLVPPLRLEVVAYLGSAPAHFKGTAGFGFWNHALAPDLALTKRKLPQALWFFFSSPESDMRLAQGVAGAGWKAATLDATRPLAKLLLPFAPLGFLLMRVPLLYRLLWGIAQRAIGVQERALELSLLEGEHTYRIDWLKDSVTFAVDEEVVLHSAHAPKNALGFIAWCDNQHAQVTPQGALAMGTLGVAQPQSLVLRRVTLSALD